MQNVHAMLQNLQTRCTLRYQGIFKEKLLSRLTVHNQKFAFVPASWKLVTVADTISHTMNSPSTLSYLSLPHIQPNVYSFNYFLNTMLTCFLFSCFYLCNIYSEKLQTLSISLPCLLRVPKENHRSFADLCPHISGSSSLIF